MRADDLRSLRDRVLAATGGDRELDAHLCALDSLQMAFCNFDEGSYHGECASPGCGKPLGLMDERTSYPRDWEDDERLPRYSGSLDAAVALCARLYPSRPTQGDIQGRSPWVGLLEEGIWTMGYESAWLRKDFGPSDLPRYVVAACLSAKIAEMEPSDAA